MPQLDPFTFSSQVFWLVAIFLTGYFLFFNYILPTVYTTLKARNRHFVNVYQQVTNYKSKRGGVEKDYRAQLLGLLLIHNELTDKLINSSLNNSISNIDSNIQTALSEDSSSLVEYYALLQSV
jgi:predicted PurR-regulated permease PerM